MKTFTLTGTSTLEGFNRFVHNKKDVPNGSKLRAKVVKVDGETRLQVYVSRKGNGTGLKNFLFGTVDQRRANVISVLKVLANRKNAPVLTDEAHAWLMDSKSATSDFTNASLAQKLRLDDPLSFIGQKVDVWRRENDVHHNTIETLANDVELFRAEVDAADAPDKIKEVRGKLEVAIESLRQAADSHNMWYLQGKGSSTGVAPRDGLDPLLKSAQLTQVQFDEIDGKQGLESVLHEISHFASKVKDLRKQADDVYANLTLKLDILETRLTEAPETAATKTVGLLEARLGVLEELTSGLRIELKADKTRNLMTKLRDPGSAPLAGREPKLAKVEIQSNNVRLSRVPVFRERVAGQIASLIACVPESMRSDPRIVKLLGDIDRCAQQHEQAMAEDETLLRECNQLIEEKLAAAAA